jgi:hypothetical protein
VGEADAAETEKSGLEDQGCQVSTLRESLRRSCLWGWLLRALAAARKRRVNNWPRHATRAKRHQHKVKISRFFFWSFLFHLSQRMSAEETRDRKKNQVNLQQLAPRTRSSQLCLSGEGARRIRALAMEPHIGLLPEGACISRSRRAVAPLIIFDVEMCLKLLSFLDSVSLARVRQLSQFWRRCVRSACCSDSLTLARSQARIR